MKKSNQIFLIKDITGYTPMISQLISMMNYARLTTIETVAGLTNEQLDHLHDSESNSIGALLRHMAAVEIGYQIQTFEGRNPTKKDLDPFGAELQLGERGRKEIKGYTLEEHLQFLQQVREKTLQEFLKYDDVWLMKEIKFWEGKQANYYFMWFHVFEDEINHRGQIRYLKKRLPQ
jgi:uncharacterized damage-inducible protein DinB